MIPDTLFLHRVTYVADKRQIVCEFANSLNRVSKRYSFFPKFFFPLRGISREQFLGVLSEYSMQRVKADFSDDTAIIFGATFSDLKKVNNLLSSYFGFYSNLVEPERQFLIGKGWSYFDQFSFSGGEPELTESFSFPDVKPDFLSASLSDTVSDVMLSDRPLAEDIVKRVVFSRLLKVPLLSKEISFSPSIRFLENVFFASSVPVSLGKTGSKKNVFFKGSSVDLSAVLSLVSSLPFNNLGFETMNCSCCSPLSSSDKNVLSSSTVEVKFLSEGFYFNSVSPTWALQFHNSNPGKLSRESRKGEYSYSFYPVGPFARGSKKRLLIADAVSMEKEGLVEIVPSSENLVWYCSKGESVLSKEISKLKSWLLKLSSEINGEAAAIVSSHGLFFSQALDSRPGFLYKSLLSKEVLQILSSIPGLLNDSSSPFFNEDFAISLDVLTASLLSDFGDLAFSENVSALSFPGSPIINVDSDSVMAVLRRFSELYGINPVLLRSKSL